MGIAPATLAMISTGAQVAGAAFGVLGALSSGEANSRAAQYQAQVAANNQVIANQNAQLELQRGQQMEAAKREQTAQMLGRARATYAASGLDPNGGTPLRTQGDIAGLGELDALTIRNNSSRAAYGYQTQGMNFSAQAGLYESQAASASRAGALGAFSSLAGGAASVADKWLDFKQKGVFGTQAPAPVVSAYFS